MNIKIFSVIFETECNGGILQSYRENLKKNLMAIKKS